MSRGVLCRDGVASVTLMFRRRVRVASKQRTLEYSECAPRVQHAAAHPSWQVGERVLVTNQHSGVVTAYFKANGSNAGVEGPNRDVFYRFNKTSPTDDSPYRVRRTTHKRTAAAYCRAQHAVGTWQPASQSRAQQTI
jgi:hypothetical protein